MTEETKDEQGPTYESLEDRYRELSRTLNVIKDLKEDRKPFAIKMSELNLELTDFVDGLDSGKISELFGLRNRCEERYSELVEEKEKKEVYGKLVDDYLNWSQSVNDAIQL